MLKVGFSIPEVLKTGRKHGASREDLYGCFYFFISEQLQEFSRRLQKFKISFCLFDQDALDLSKAVRNGELARAGIPSTTLFNRIDVSNIMDVEYVGIEKVISSWCSLLAPGTDSTLLGSFLNWVKTQEGAKLTHIRDSRRSRDLIKKGIDQLQEEGRVCRPSSLT